MPTGLQIPQDAIVVGYDGSAASQVALEWAARTAQDRGLGLHILAARDSDHAPDLTAEFTEECRREYPQLTVTASAPVGNPRYLLVEASDAAAAVVVGNRGRSRWRAAILGTTSLSTAQHADCPVVIVRAGGQWQVPPRRVIVGVDGSGSSAAAIDYGLRLAAPNAHITLMMAWSAASTQDQVPPFARDLVERTLGDRDVSGIDLEIAVPPGHPVDVLTEASKHADLMVMGRRGADGFTGMHIGSTATHVLNQSACPVMLIPQPEEDQHDE